MAGPNRHAMPGDEPEEPLPNPAFAERYRLEALLDLDDDSWLKQARDALLDRPVALSALRGSLARDPRAVSAALEAARLQARLQHPGIAPVHDLGLDDDGDLALVVGPMRGESLRGWLDSRRRGPLDRRDIQVFLGAMIRACEALEFAHQRGLVHSGIEPGRLFLHASGLVRLSGWASACASGAAPPPQARGDPRYWSPERARGEPLDWRADAFALGAMLYELLAGAPPYGRPTSVDQAMELARIGRIAPPEAAALDRSIPAGLSLLAMAALGLEGAEEPLESVGDLRERLEAFLFGIWRTRLQGFAAGARVIEQGARGQAAYVIISGQARVLLRDAGGEHSLATLGPEDTFGEMALLLDRPHAASVEAASELLTRVINRRVFEGWFDGEAAAWPFFRFLAHRIQSRDRDVLAHRRRARESALRLAVTRALAHGPLTLPALLELLAPRRQAPELRRLLTAWGFAIDAASELVTFADAR